MVQIYHCRRRRRRRLDDGKIVQDLLVNIPHYRNNGNVHSVWSMAYTRPHPHTNNMAIEVLGLRVCVDKMLYFILALRQNQ